MKTLASTPTATPRQERDFLNEYNELMSIAGRDVARLERDWNRNGGRIQKFSLFDITPTPILTDNTFPINC